MWRRIAIYASLLAMVAFAVFFSVTIFAQNSLRLDEAQSLFQVNRGIPGMLNLVAQDVHVPLYHTLLHYWIIVFGQSVFSARMMSLLFFVGTILMTYVLASYAFGRRSIGVFAALLVTLSPFTNWYGSEARMYTMLAFMATLHAYLFLKALRKPHVGRWILWGIVTVFGLYTHYFFAFVMLSELVAVVMMRNRFESPHPIRSVILVGGIASLSLLPWLLYVYHLGFASNTQPALGEPSPGDLFDTYAQFVFGFQTSTINTVIVSLWPVAVLLGFFALQRSSKKIPPETLVFVLFATLPVILAFVISVTIKPFYISRYLIVSLPALLILISWLLTRYRRSIAVASRIVLVAIIGALFVIQIINPNTPVKEDYREAVDYLDAHVTGSDVVILSAPFTIYPFEYYYKGPAKLTTQPIWNQYAPGGIPGYDAFRVEAETKANVGSYQHAWLLLSYDQGYNDKLLQYYDGHYQRLMSKEFSPGMTLYEYKIRYDKPLTISQ
jgi:mannosyltransferase